MASKGAFQFFDTLCLSMEYNSFSFSPRRCVHFIICHYLIYVWHKRHFPLFLFFFFLHWTHIVENFHELVSYSILQCILFGISPAPFLFHCVVGEYIDSLHNWYSILQIRNWPRHSDCTNLSPCTNIFFFLQPNTISLSSNLVITP